MEYEKSTYCPMFHCIFNAEDEEDGYRCAIGKSCYTCGLFSKAKYCE